MSGWRIALACMTPAPDTNELGELRLPSYGIRRILAAVVADPLLAESSVALVDFGTPDTDAYVDAIMRLEPDLVGLSIYVWSMACMVEVARRIKRQRPHCTIFFGGPSARPAMFDLPLFAGAHQYLDAVVTTEGEGIFRDIARLPELSRTSLRSVLGLHLPANGAWLQTSIGRPPNSLMKSPRRSSSTLCLQGRSRTSSPTAVAPCRAGSANGVPAKPRRPCSRAITSSVSCTLSRATARCCRRR